MVGGHDHWSSSSSCTLLSLSTIHFFAVVTGPVCERVLKDGQGENWCSVCSRCWSVFPRSASSFHPVLSVPGSCTHPSVISAAVGVLQKFKTRQEVAFRQVSPFPLPACTPLPPSSAAHPPAPPPYPGGGLYVMKPYPPLFTYSLPPPHSLCLTPPLFM